MGCIPFFGIDKFDRESFAAFLNMIQAPEALVAESKTLANYWGQNVKDRDLGPHPEKPIALLLGTKGFPSYPPTPPGLTKPWDSDELWFEAHIEKRITTFSKWPLMFKNCYVVISTDAWHHFQRDEPEIIIDITRKMLKE